MQRIRHNGDAANLWRNLAQQFEALGIELYRYQRDTRRIVERMGKVFGNAKGDWIGTEFIDDGSDSPALDHTQCCCRVRNDDIDTPSLKFGDQRGNVFEAIIGEQQLEREPARLGITEHCQPSRNALVK